MTVTTSSTVLRALDPGGRPIAFRSTAIEPGYGGLAGRGELELAGTRRPASFELNADADDGRVRGTLPVTQSDRFGSGLLRMGGARLERATSCF